MLPVAVSSGHQHAGRSCFGIADRNQPELENLALLMTEAIAPISNEAYFFNFNIL
jgi:hypothetical protein